MNGLFRVERVFALLAAALISVTLSGPGRADYVSGLDPRGDNFLSLRTGPGSKYREISRLGPNTFLTVEARRGAWLKVRLQDGGTGWVFGKYVAPGAPPSPPGYAAEPRPGGGATVGYVSGLDPRGDNFLSLRLGPGGRYQEIRRLGPGAQVAIFERLGDWFRVEVADGARGWVFHRYITIAAQPPGAAPDSSMALVPPPPAPVIEPPQPVPPPAAMPAASGWTIYENPRFGTRIEYPADLFTPLPPPENGDGLSFRSVDGTATFIVFGQFNVLERTVEEMMADDLASGLYEQVTYRRKGADWYVLSGYRQGEVFYRKVIVPTGTDMLHAFEIDYPPQQKAVYDTVTARMAKSLGAPIDAGIATGPANVDLPQTVEAPPPRPMNTPPDSAPEQTPGDLRSLLRAEFRALSERVQ